MSFARSGILAVGHPSKLTGTFPSFVESFPKHDESSAKFVESSARSPRASVAGLRLFAQLLTHSIVPVPLAVKLLETTPPTAAEALGFLESLGMLRESFGHKRERLFNYDRYLELLVSGMK